MSKQTAQNNAGEKYDTKLNQMKNAVEKVVNITEETDKREVEESWTVYQIHRNNIIGNINYN